MCQYDGGIARLSELTDLVTIAHGGPQVLVPRRAPRAHLHGAQHPLHQLDVVVCNTCAFPWVVQQDFCHFYRHSSTWGAFFTSMILTSPLSQCDFEIHEQLEEERRLVEPGLLFVEGDHQGTCVYDIGASQDNKHIMFDFCKYPYPEALCG